MRKGNIYGIQGTKKKRPSDRDAHGSALDWTLLNMQACEINLLWAKRGPGYFVLLNKVAMAALRILQERSTTGAVIRNERNGAPLDNSKTWLERCCRRARIVGISWHSLRPTFSTRLTSAGVPLEDPDLGCGVVQLMNPKRFAILVSRVEGQPIVTLEAAAMGRATLLTAVHGSVDLIPSRAKLKNGLDYGNVKELAGAVQSWFAHPDDWSEKVRSFFIF
jgi:hypothetical protein